MSIVSAFTVELNESSIKAIDETDARSKDPKWNAINLKIKKCDSYSIDGRSLVIISAEKFIDLPSPLWVAGAIVISIYFWLGWSLWMLTSLLFVLFAFMQSSYWLQYSFALTLRKAGYKGSQKRIATKDALRWICFGRT